MGPAMNKVRLVEPYHSPAMRRYAEPLQRTIGRVAEVECGDTADEGATLNYHIPWHTLIGLPADGSKHIALYTHCNPGMEQALKDACDRADAIVCMSFAGRAELMVLGVSPSKLRVIYPAVEMGPARKRNIGVIGTEQPNGRKRSHLLLDLAWSMDLSPLHFVIVGTGWADTVAKLENMGVSVQYHAMLPEPQMPQLYNTLDLLLVTGYTEGGPLPLMEAMAFGVPVLSPKYGLAEDLGSLVEYYEGGDGLVRALKRFIAPAVDRVETASLFSVKNFIMEHTQLFERVIGQTIGYGDDPSPIRYNQLTALIDQHKPKTIVEIGTWYGDRAWQMIQDASRYHPMQDITYWGFDLFDEATPSVIEAELSKTPPRASLVYRRLAATGARVHLITGNTKDTLPRYRVAADLFFIDGGHSYPTIQHDFEALSPVLYPGAVAVLDDYYSGDFPEGMGCQALVNQLDPALWHVGALPVICHYDKPWGRMGIRMVKVGRK